MDDTSTSASVDTAPVNDTNAADSGNEQQEGSEDQQQSKASSQVAGQEKKQAQSNKKKFKLKVDGQELEEEIDLADEETLKRHLQMSKAAQKRMSEAAQVRRQAEELVGMFKGDLKSVLKQADKLGKSPEQVRKELEDYFMEVIQEETLTPEQKTIREAQRIVQENEERSKREAEEKEAAIRTQLEEKYAQDYDRKITDALMNSGLPKTARTVKRMASLMAKNLDLGLELEPKDLVHMVREDYLSEIKELFGATDGDTLLKLLGDDVANKIRKSDLARLRAPKQPTKVEVAPRDNQPKKRMTTEEWLAEVRKRAQS